MAAKYSYNLARDQNFSNMKRSRSTLALISSPLTLFRGVTSHMFGSPSASQNPPDQNPENDPPPVLDLPNPEGEDDDFGGNSNARMDVTSKDDEVNKENQYERILEEENRRLTDFIQDILPASDCPEEDFKQCFQTQMESVNDRVKMWEIKYRSLEDFHRRDKEEMERKHEMEMMELRNLYEGQIEKVVQENRELIDEIINSQINEIQLWRLEYEAECLKKGVDPEVGDADSGADGGGGGGDEPNNRKNSITSSNNRDLPKMLLEKFKELSPISQGIIVAGIGVASLVIGYYSWPFLNWAWPRLAAFATDARVLNAATWIITFTQSRAYKEVVEAWEKGEPMSPVLFRNFGEDIVNLIRKLAPMLVRVKGTTVQV